MNTDTQKDCIEGAYKANAERLKALRSASVAHNTREPHNETRAVNNQCPVCKKWYMSQRQLISHATKQHNWLPSKDGKTAYLITL